MWVMNRREFLGASLAAAPVLLGAPPAAGAPRRAIGLATADKEAHVIAVRLAGGRIVKRIPTREDPRSIERQGRGPAVVAHSGAGVISLIDPAALDVRRVLGGFHTPRYTAIGRDGEVAYVTDGGNGELAVVDLVRGRVIRRIAVGAGARHIAISPDRTTLWISLGSSAATIAIVDVGAPLHPRVRRHVHPPFLAHDVGFSPTGRRVWVTAGREAQLAVYSPDGRGRAQLLGADAAPQHIAFGPTYAYVASGNAGRVRLYRLSGARSGRAAGVPLGSYNVVRGAGRVLTPSLGAGTLTILDPHGHVLHEVRVASAAHDACVIS
jgi:DNA-binding beta-propeller fold protein YncE